VSITDFTMDSLSDIYATYNSLLNELRDMEIDLMGLMMAKTNGGISPEAFEQAYKFYRSSRDELEADIIKFSDRVTNIHMRIGNSNYVFKGIPSWEDDEFETWYEDEYLFSPLA